MDWEMARIGDKYSLDLWELFLYAMKYISWEQVIFFPPEKKNRMA